MSFPRTRFPTRVPGFFITRVPGYPDFWRRTWKHTSQNGALFPLSTPPSPVDKASARLTRDVTIRAVLACWLARRCAPSRTPLFKSESSCTSSPQCQHELFGPSSRTRYTHIVLTSQWRKDRQTDRTRRRPSRPSFKYKILQNKWRICGCWNQS